MKKIGVLIGILLGLLSVTYFASHFIGLPSGTTTSSTSPNTNISAIILPHHDLVKAQRQTFLGEVKENIDTPRTIILLSPNHYETGTAEIQTTDRTWEVSSGQISPDLEVIKSLEGLTLKASQLREL